MSTPDPIAVTPAAGPLPAMYVPPAPGAPGRLALLWHTVLGTFRGRRH